MKTVVNTIQHDERKTMNIDKDKLQRTGKYAEETQEINGTWESFKCIEVTFVFVIFFIFAWIVHCGVNKVMQNKLDVIQLVQQLIISSSVRIIFLVRALVIDRLFTSTAHVKVPIQPVGILHICNLWIRLRKIVIYLVGRKLHLHRLFAVKVDGSDVYPGICKEVII